MSDAASLSADQPAALGTDDALLLCATPALARARREAYALTQKQAGLAVWTAPNIADWPSWIARQWAQSWPAEQLLSSAQLLALWEDVVAADEAADGVVSRRALAREAMRTASLVDQHQITLTDAPRWTPEQAAFERWSIKVQQRLADNTWITAAQVPAAFAAYLDNGGAVAGLPSCIELDGTDIQALLPSEQSVFDALAAGGVDVVIPSDDKLKLRPVRPAQPAQGTALPDPTAQWRWLAQDIRARFIAAGDDAELPRISIACTNPEDAKQWIDAEVAPVLAPWLADPAEIARPVPWRIESASALSDQPACAAALAVMRLKRFGNDFAGVSRVLLAGALWAGPARDAAAQLEAALRTSAAPMISLGDCVRNAPRGLSERFQGLDNALRAEPGNARPSAWVAILEERLHAIGWPGPAAQSSAGFQAARTTREALAALGTLDAQLGTVTRSEAVRWFGELCNRSFAPRAESVQAIQVLTFEEAALMPADCVYVVDATDTALPQPVQRHSLIAGELQACIPTTTPQGQRARAVAIARGLLSKPCVPIFAAIDARGAEADPSPLLIRDIVAPEQLVAATLPVRQSVLPSSDPVPPVDDDERKTLRGGSGILSAYLESPMIAVLKHRLGIAELEEAPRGLTAMQQGALMHKVLEEFWRQTQDSHGLAALSDAAAHERIELIVAEVLPKYAPTSRYPKQVVASEGVRARILAERWIRHERGRIDAFRVIARERKAELTLEGLPLRITIDRVDIVETRQAERPERVLIIDYKTSKAVNPNSWRAEKLADPQLPLYATPEAQDAADLEHVDGIGFAQIHRAKRWLAVVTNWTATVVDGDKPGIAQNRNTPDYNTFMANADAALREIVRGLLAGESAVDYKALGKGGFGGGAHPMLAVLPPPKGSALVEMLAQDEGAA